MSAQQPSSPSDSSNTSTPTASPTKALAQDSKSERDLASGMNDNALHKAPSKPRESVEIPAALSSSTSSSSSSSSSSLAQFPVIGGESTVILSSGPVTTLLAPRPIRARRHQKSIISLENFGNQSSATLSKSSSSVSLTSQQLVPAAIASSSSPSVAPGTSRYSPATVDMIAARAAAATNASLQAHNDSDKEPVIILTSSSNDVSKTVDDTAAVVASKLQELNINTSSSTSNNTNPNPTKTHKRNISTNSEFGEEIPFPSISGEINTNNSNALPKTRDSISNRPSMSSLSGYSSTGMFRRQTSTRSRKSSLLQSWDYQPIRISGADLVGETDVSILMPAASGQSTRFNGSLSPTYGSNSSGYFGNTVPDNENADMGGTEVVRPKPQHVSHNSLGSGDISMNDIDRKRPPSRPTSRPSSRPSFLHHRSSSSLSIQTSGLTFQPMQIYSPNNEAVSELFQIMRNTGSSYTPSTSANPTPNPGEVAQHQYYNYPLLNEDNLSRIDEHMTDTKPRPQTPPFSKSKSPDDNTMNSTPVPNRRPSLVWPGWNSGNMSTPSHHQRQSSGSNLQSTPGKYLAAVSGFNNPINGNFYAPPSPVSRSTRNPILKNDQFRREMEMEVDSEAEMQEGQQQQQNQQASTFGFNSNYHHHQFSHGNGFTGMGFMDDMGVPEMLMSRHQDFFSTVNNLGNGVNQTGFGDIDLDLEMNGLTGGLQDVQSLHFTGNQ